MESILIVKQIWTANKFRNFNYLIVCPKSGEAMAVDPLDYEQCLSISKSNGWEITKILNTHEHWDHTGGNQPLVEKTGAQLLAHHNAKDTIENIDIGLKAGDSIKIGKTITLEVLDTPGHTMSHVCLFANNDTPALFCGDTLFNAGVGHCKGGGNPEDLYETFINQIFNLPDHTKIYPGHDYWENNLKFTLDREPENIKARDMINEERIKNPNDPFVSTLGMEKEVNTFFRLKNPNIIEKLREVFPKLSRNPEMREVFLKLRELRNDW